MAPIVIPLTRDQLESKRAAAAQQGFLLDGDHGDAIYNKVAVQYDYDGTNLTILVTHKPMLYPASAVEAAIRNWFQRS